ncbi:MAG: hypothetical protein KC729_01265 [Candidatus Eisenbacteria bacterium]|uniref:Uncharacterized protein n=1 Tax=Eiseniibacteriota bacterium TaxID=2212470 RepID=A0A956RNF0_UNCEI|nr:hypothetical protein [Candidatus Eisenbacteria bacterium]
MPISGLVLSLDSTASVDYVVAQIQGDSRLVVGKPSGKRLPLVIDTRDAREDRALWIWLESLPGIAAVNVVYIGFDESGFDDRCERTAPTHRPVSPPSRRIER